jgi:hypothetical protein
MLNWRYIYLPLGYRGFINHLTFFSRQALIPEAHISGGHYGTGTGFSQGAAVFPRQCHSTKAPHCRSAKPNYVGSQKSHVARTHRLVWAMLTAMGLGPTLLARSAKGRKVNGQIKTRRGWYSQSWGQLCLSLSSLSLLVTPAARPVRRHWTTDTAASPSTD